MTKLKLDETFIEGVFIKESKHRFLCEVLINDKVFECHVPSSVKLKNYLKLENKQVILTKNKSLNTRTQYSLFAIKYYNQFIIINLALANKLVEEKLSKMKTFQENNYVLSREKIINNYKTDFTIFNSTSTEIIEIIEVKSIVGIRRTVKFPNTYSERMILQLQKILSLLKLNMNVSYYIVSLSPIVKEITLNNKLDKFYNLFINCINNGMRVKGFTLNFKDCEFYITEKLIMHN